MELSYSDLKKRDVINIPDGKCLGRIIDLRLRFPEGKLTGIVVPGRKDGWFFRVFNRSKIFIPECNIIKIGGDVILVNIDGRRFDEGGPNNNNPHKNNRPTPPNCPPSCPPVYQPCPPAPCPPGQPRGPYDSGRIDLSDY